MASFQIKNFNSLVSSMINTVRGLTTKITDFNVGGVTRTLLEAVAQEIEELYYQTFIGLIEATEFIFLAFNFPRRPATKAVGTVTFSSALAVASDVIIPQGTIVRTADNINFDTTQEVTLLQSTSSIDAPVRATTAGTEGNVDAGAIVEIATPVNFITGVTNAAATVGGDDDESREERRGRFAEFIASLSRATRIALEFAAKDRIDGVVASQIIENPRVFVLNEDVSSGVFSEITLPMNTNDPFGQSIAIFPASFAVGDNVYFGLDFAFDFLAFFITDPADPSFGDGTWQYFNGSTWVALTVEDATDKFRIDSFFRTVSFVRPADFTYTRVNNVLRFWIRFNITDAAFTSNPKVAEITTRPIRGTAEIYIQDAAGNAPAALLQAAQNQVELVRAAGIPVGVFAPEQISIDITAVITVDPIFDKDGLAAEARQSIIDFLIGKRLGQILFEAEICQLVMNLDDEGILDIDLSKLQPTALPSAPAVDDVMIGLNQIAQPGTIAVSAVSSS